MAEYIDLAIARIGMAMVLADGEVNRDEMETWLGEMVDWDVSDEAIVQVLESVKDDNFSMEDFFKTAITDVIVIAEQGTDELKEDLWATAVKVMISDGDMDENEMALATAMGDAWGFEAD